MTTATLYRCFDGAGTLLYVGVTENIDTRLAQHRTQAHWFPQVASVHTEDVPLLDALAIERRTIRTENPAHNIQHRQFGTPASQAYDPTDQAIIGTADVARIVGVAAATVKRWAARGRLPYHAKLAGSTGGYVFHIDTVAEFVRADIAERQTRLDAALERWALEGARERRAS